MRSVRSIALGILIRVERDGAHAAPLLDAKGRDLPQNDRDLLRALVKRTIRGAIRLDHVLSRHVDRPVEELDVSVRNALRLGAAQLLLLDRIPSHAAVDETVDALKEIAPRAAGLANAVLRRVAKGEARPGVVLLAETESPVRRLALETSHPEWLVGRWVKRFGLDAARAALLADDEDSPVDLLMDPRAGDSETVAAQLAAEGIETVASPWAPLARTVTQGNPLSHPLVSSGVLAVVDAAAQGVVELVARAPIVVDLAAAPGGKTRTLLARGIARRVVAVERHATRISRMAANLAAAGRRGEALLVLADGERAPLPAGRFPSVLLDAPCSGTGTLRKNPEIRLRLKPADPAGFAVRQRALLVAAADLLLPGGVVTYVTCSLEREENEDVVAEVLAGRADLERVGAESAPEALLAHALADGSFRILPGRSNDGFTVTRLRRR